MRNYSLALVASFCLFGAGCAARYPDDRFVALVHHVRPAIVLLTMKVPSEDKKYKDADEFATGVVIASGPWGSDVLTVAHAVDGAWNMRATISNKTKINVALVALDKDLDIALLRTKTPALPTVHLGTSANLSDELGRDIGLLGYPIPDEFEDEELGLDTSLATGRLSSVRKGALEVTVPIVPGESGAPVFVIDSGELIGIAESRFDDEHSIGFALPVDDAKRFLHKNDAAHGF